MALRPAQDSACFSQKYHMSSSVLGEKKKLWVLFIDQIDLKKNVVRTVQTSSEALLCDLKQCVKDKAKFDGSVVA